jgi:hypothetical protein
MRFTSLFLASGFASLLISLPALADIPPEDACSAAEVGKACNTAVIGDRPDQPGVCRKETCTRPYKDGDVQYDCYRCEAGDDTGSGGAGGQPSESSAGQPSKSAGGQPSESAGTGGSSVTPAAGPGGTGETPVAGTSGSGGTGAASKPSKKDDGGCSVSSARGSGVALLGIAVAMGAALGMRRQRRRS